MRRLLTISVQQNEKNAVTRLLTPDLGCQGVFHYFCSQCHAGVSAILPIFDWKIKIERI
jgi:hypothetical protein